MPRHKHADAIIAWANGAKIEVRSTCDGSWGEFNYSQPAWLDCCEYRIKPEPKPDVVLNCNVTTTGDVYLCAQGGCYKDNLRLYLDGETGKLKSAEVING